MVSVERMQILLIEAGGILAEMWAAIYLSDYL
jgi:hypothetical protein